jgi:hypothetical protein
MSSPFQGSVSVGQPAETVSEPLHSRIEKRPSLRASHPVVGHSHGGGANEEPRPARMSTPRIRRITQPSEWWLPDWVREHVDSNASVDDLIAETMRRAIAAPNEATFVTVQAVFNELSRDPAHATAVRRAVRTLVEKILRKKAS